MTEHNFYGGTSGLVSPIPQRDHPPEFRDKSRLAYYASLFNSIEINSSFYKMPLKATVEKWAESVPADFRFTFKLWQGITHNKGLIFNSDDVFKFMDTINGAGSKKGCLLIQFPPGLAIQALPQLADLLQTIKKANERTGWSIAVEFRNKSWYTNECYNLLADNKAALVIHDMPDSETPLMEPDQDFVYLRFHGPDGGYRGSYTDGFLYEYSLYINEWREDGKIVYVYFNNTVGGALENLLTLKKYV